VVLATLTPAKASYNESMSTLAFANRCQDIHLKPVANEILDGTPPQVVINRLQTELKQMEDRHQAVL
jgi:hypothetical protein